MEKNIVWLWKAIDRVSRKSLGWKLGARCHATAKELVDKVMSPTCLFVTDQWKCFFKLLPEGRHFYGKDLTFPIEATNSDIRHRLARFSRKTKASSRSLAMIDASIALFHHLQNPDVLNFFLTPMLSFFS
jgi:insertion element IS1 protein InsB